MPYVSENVTQAVAIAGFNIGDGKWWATGQGFRKIVRFGLVAGAALGDTVIELAYGSRKVAEIKNTTAGVSSTNGGSCKHDVDLKDLSDGAWCKPGEPINVIVKTQPTTNALEIELDIVEAKPRSNSYGRRY